jgi:hypothetical protein
LRSPHCTYMEGDTNTGNSNVQERTAEEESVR